MINIHVVHTNRELTLLTDRVALVGPGLETQLKWPLQAIAVFVELSEDANGNPGPWWMEFVNHGVFGVVENADGAHVAQYDPPGGGSGGARSLNIRQFNANHVIGPSRQLEERLSNVIAGQGACWDVFDEGTTMQYQTLVAEARLVVALPGSSVQADSVMNLTPVQRLEVEAYRQSLVAQGRWRKHDNVT